MGIHPTYSVSPQFSIVDHLEHFIMGGRCCFWQFIQVG